MMQTHFLSITSNIGIAAALVLMNAFFVAAELALVKVQQTQLQTLSRSGSRSANVALKLKGNINAAISTVQVGITLAGLLTGRYVEPMLFSALEPALDYLGVADIEWMQHVVAAVSFGAITFILIVAGEMIPKAIALRKTVPIAVWVSRPLGWFYIAAFPLIWLIDTSSRYILKKIGFEPTPDETFSSEELRSMVAASTQRNDTSLVSRGIILNAFNLRHRVVGEVMTPRREISYLNTNAPIHECLYIAESSRYSRFPLAENGDLDRVLGVIHCKDLFARRNSALTALDLTDVAYPVIAVPERAPLEQLLDEFLRSQLHLAIVVDEYGSTVGLITLENVLEELVGQIQDEFDTEQPRIIERSENQWEFSGSLPLYELAELTDENFSSDAPTTVYGWVMQRLGGVPKVGDRLPLGRFELTVEELDEHRVKRFRLTRLPSP